MWFLKFLVPNFAEFFIETIVCSFSNGASHIHTKRNLHKWPINSIYTFDESCSLSFWANSNSVDKITKFILHLFFTKNTDTTVHSQHKGQQMCLKKVLFTLIVWLINYAMDETCNSYRHMVCIKLHVDCKSQIILTFRSYYYHARIYFLWGRCSNSCWKKLNLEAYIS